MPGAAWLPPHRLGALSESSAELGAPAPDRFVRDHDATLEQQLLDVAQAQAETKVPANGATDDDSRESVAVIKRFRLLHRVILPPPLQQPDSAQERDIEQALTRHITRFLLELGAGFAFVGRQYRLDVGGDEFFIDILFYHLKLRCYVVVELKTTPFRPEYAGQLNFYLSAIDAQVKAPDDQPTIGLLLCKEKNRLVAEYALRGVAKPMGVAEYQLLRQVPESLETKLPSIDQIEAELRPDLPDDA